eukprot:g13378.t1
MTDEDVRRLQMQVEQERAEVEEQLNLERQAIEAQKDPLMSSHAMEEKMLVGSQVMEKAMQQEADLRRAAMEVEEKKREEQRMQEELEQQQEEKLELEEKYASTEEQVQKMTAKLEKLWHRHKQTQQEVQDLQHEFQSEREDMLDTIRDLRKEVKLVCLTIENFIPMEQYQQIEQRAHFDESSDEWVISNIDLAGNRVRRRGRLLDESPKGMGRRTNGEGSPDPVAMMNERPNVYFAYTEDGGAQRAETRPQPQKNGKQQRVKSAGRPGTASRKGRGVKQVLGANFLHSPDPIEDENDAAFPKARGLVPEAQAARSRRARDGVGSAVMTLGVQKTIQKTSAGDAKAAATPASAPSVLPDDFTVDKDARYTGSVIDFNKWRGFGHITMDEKGVVPGDKVFVHWKNIQTDDRFPRLQQGLQTLGDLP